jgi:hypothetical protein
MRLSPIVEEILNELHGVSFDARAWMSVILYRIGIEKNHRNITIKGSNYPKEFRKFPVDKINVTINPDFPTASYDENKSGYDNNGEYHIYFVFGTGHTQPSAIHHELRHAYEDFMRMSKGKPGLSKSKEGKSLFSGDFEKFMLNGGHYGPFNNIMTGLYFTSKIERSAYAETVYDGNSVTDYIKKAIYDNSISIIQHRYKPADMEIWWNKLKQEYRIPIFDKFKDYLSFIKWASDEIKYKGEKSLKKLRNIQYRRDMNKKRGINY